MVYAPTSHNRSVYASPPYGGSGSAKPQSGLRPWYGFVSATVWAGVNASHCPITCPNRRKQPERYAKGRLNYIMNIRNIDKKRKIL